jgi:hypothetical protein
MKQQAEALGSRWELFVDDGLVESKRGVALRLTTPVRREIVLTTDRLWEGPASAYFTAIQDGKKVRLYYRGYCPGDQSLEQVTCLAESDDGIHFSRPNLGLFAFRGSKANNIVWQGLEAHNFAPFLDTNPKARPDARYKALGGINSKLYAFGSPDGVRWQKLSPTAVLTDGTFDSLNTAFFDEALGKYRLYSRYFTQGEYSGYRAIQSCLSDDFLRWSKPEPNRYAPGTPTEHFYTNAVRPCPGAPHVLLSFPKRFVPERTKLAGYKEPGVSDAVFMSSRDGLHWSRPFLEAWLRPGPDPHNWTQRSNMPATGIIETGEGEFSLYASEHYDWPDHRLRRITVRRHGFASVHADASGGEFTTRLLTVTGSRLVLNYATSAAGSIQVEVLDPAGKPLAQSKPLFGDELEGALDLNLASLSGKPIKLRFLLKDADLYAFRTK